MTHPIPFVALDGKVGILGITGSGKTFTAIGLVEQLLEAGRQTIIVDPTGVYSGLRTMFPLPIFGGKFGDVQIGEDSGEAIARLIVEKDLSAIVDVSQLLKQSHAAARRFMGPFVAALKNAPTRARYLVMDEADEFMPENASGDSTRLFGDLKWIVRRGRSEGWRVMMVTQRPQDIAKSVLTQCETLVVHNLTSPQDRKAVQEWVKGNAEEGQAKVVLDSLASLTVGEAWVWSPRHGLLERVKMPANKSEDRSKTPDADDGPRATLGFQAIDLAAISAALAKPLNDLPPTNNSGEILKSAAEANDLRVELSSVRRRLADMTYERDHWQERATVRMKLIERARAALQANGDDVPAQGGGLPEVDDGNTSGAVPAAVHSEKRQLVGSRPERATMEPQVVTDRKDDQLTTAARKMIDALARHYPRALPIEHIAKIAGVSRQSSQWRANLRSFADSAFVKPFVVVNQWEMTTFGRDQLGLAGKPDDPGALLDFWLGSFPPSTGAMLREIVKAAPAALGKADIAALAGVSPTSSGLTGGLRELRDHGLIQQQGDGYRAAEVLL